LKSLKEDEEFRYAIAGYLGYSEVLKRLEEHDKKSMKFMKKLEKYGKNWKNMIRNLTKFQMK